MSEQPTSPPPPNPQLLLLASCAAIGAALGFNALASEAIAKRHPSPIVLRRLKDRCRDQRVALDAQHEMFVRARREARQLAENAEGYRRIANERGATIDQLCGAIRRLDMEPRWLGDQSLELLDDEGEVRTRVPPVKLRERDLAGLPEPERPDSLDD